MDNKIVKIIEYILNTNEDEIVSTLQKRNDLDIATVIKQMKDSRTQYGLKVQHIIELLEEK